ncbi:MAG: cytochrome c oxidase accessory protein CcoG [Gammaproteobacteria bacterium]|uniref:cytochrome c oxidase accessory protein CcoG n=1 Tax=Azohydromonas sp. TaxID=1872666 RepID=UPI002C45FD36|nr:cytochrome c oxidase accessory protein CcoG [Azohydromonas sp.]HMM86672.1 cytochrome c oxidase accessory protein CcoG [Azohydromonas sp.]
MASPPRTPPRVIPIAPAADDSAAMVSLYEKQPKVYPRSVSGVFARWRWIMVWLTQLVFYGVPWLQWDGRQAVLFDLVERRFHLFGLVLQPQDLIFLAALLVISALALFFFTAVAGRLWCGYACPQTVYTEIFLWIERRIEGDRLARMQLDAAPWSARKLARKGGKHAAWIAVSLFTGFTFVGYFTPVRVLLAELATWSLSPWETFWVLFYGFATYGNAGFLREQICKYMCPYARFQSTLIDADSLVIAYDAARGEARGSRSRKADAKALGLGDCIDCTLCVQVCPTGIDIRNGLQNECIGCAACIDVCDDVMGKMGYAPGLIRYATDNGVRHGWTRAQMLRRVLRPRVLVYGALLLALSVAFVVAIALRSGHTVDVLRDRGALARLVDGGHVENVYRLQIANRGASAQRYRVDAGGLPGLVLAGDAEIVVGPYVAGMLAVRLTLPPETAQSLASGAHPIEFRVRRAGDGAPGETVRAASTFYVPR